jgi:hypothetical protein
MGDNVGDGAAVVDEEAVGREPALGGVALAGEGFLEAFEGPAGGAVDEEGAGLVAEVLEAVLDGEDVVEGVDQFLGLDVVERRDVEAR